jgi:Putative peptidoglycan binding domain
MKKLTSLLIGCSLTLAGAALAQEPVEQQSPGKGKHAQQKAHATQAQPGANAARPQERPGRHPGAMKERGATNERAVTNQPGAERGQKTHAGHESANAPETNAPANSTSETANEPGAGEGRKGRAHQDSATGTDVSGRAAGMPTYRGQHQVERKQGQGVKQPMAETGGTSATSQQNVQANAGAKAKKPDAQAVQQVKSQHTSFRAQPKPQQVQSVTFNQSRRIEGSEHWQGTQYEVFRSYHPEWHDAGWYHSHFGNVVLIAGGYYFFNNGYWFPAWGYNPSSQYYAYDGPIYVGQRAVPPDQVIADTQALLQQMGYYKGEVDGLLGPLTREALTAYQADNGLTTTAAIDEPTLDSLGLA